MNHAIIVAGGVGSRMMLDIPKQYYEVRGVPIIMFSIRKFLIHPLIDSIVIVMADEWKDYMQNHLILEDRMGKRIFFARAGKSRQHSVYNGLNSLLGFAQDNDMVLIHDSVRPLFPISVIIDGIEACKTFDMALPVISVKDATYQSFDGTTLDKVLPRQELFSGQSPECAKYGLLYKAHSLFSDDDLSNIKGCSELALKAGLSVKLIPGTEQNFKITTIEDLHAFELIINKDY